MSDSIRNIIQQVIREDIFRQDNKIKKHEKLIIDAAIDFMKSKFNFDAKIIVKKKQNPSLIGDISLNYNSVVNNKFTLHFNPNKGFDQIIKALIHELTHVKQVSKGELKPSEDYKSIIWNETQKISVKDHNKVMKNFNEYKNLPWEKEAYGNMYSLYDDFLNSSQWKNLEGKNETLDFIIKNIKDI